MTDHNTIKLGPALKAKVDEIEAACQAIAAAPLTEEDRRMAAQHVSLDPRIPLIDSKGRDRQGDPLVRQYKKRREMEKVDPRDFVQVMNYCNRRMMEAHAADDYDTQWMTMYFVYMEAQNGSNTI